MKESVYIITGPTNTGYKIECPCCSHEEIFSGYEEVEEMEYYICEICGNEYFVEFQKKYFD